MLRAYKSCWNQCTNLISQKGTIFTVQRINIILKEVKKKYRLKIKNFSCHSLRKTFGRQVYNMNSDNAELALVKLMELFNHSSVAITKDDFGIKAGRNLTDLWLFELLMNWDRIIKIHLYSGLNSSAPNQWNIELRHI